MDQRAVARGSRTRFRWIVGVEVGVVVGLLTDIVPFLGVLLVIGLLVALPVARLRNGRSETTAGVAGMLVGAGIVYLVFVVNMTAECAGTADFCGDANVLPLWILALVTLGLGCLGTIWSRPRTRAGGGEGGPG